MSGGTARGTSPGRSLAWILGLAALVAVGVQGSGWAQPSDDAAHGRRKGEVRKETSSQPGQAAQKEAAKPAASTAQPVTRTIGGVQVAIDPRTGQVRPPTAEEAAALVRGLEQMLTQDTEDLPVIQMPDGSQMVNLLDTFQDVAMATKDKRGKVTVHCVNQKEQAMALLAGTDPAADARAAGGRKTDHKLTHNGLEKE